MLKFDVKLFLSFSIEIKIVSNFELYLDTFWNFLYSFYDSFTGANQLKVKTVLSTVDFD